MAYQKAYSRINWENYPSEQTPLNEANLNKIDVAMNEVDNRVISLDSTKFDKTEASTLIKNFELDKTTGVITITYLSGATATIDTMLEKLAVNFDFDKTSQKLVIVLDDGTVKEIDLTALITEYEFKSTDTVAFSVDADGNVSAIVKDGSIQERHLRPNYLADIRVESAKAEASAIRAEQAETNAVTSADNATQFVDEAMRQLESGELKGDRGSVIHSGNKVHLATGGSPEGIISNFIDGVLAGDYYINENAGDYFICTNVENGKSYWDFIINLKGIEGRRGSKIFVAEDDVFFPPLNVQEQAYTNDIIINSTTGDMYEVTGDNNSGPSSYFDYKLVGNIKGPKGDVAASAVTGIKGNAETTYRTGDVNITPENIGAIPKTGGAVTGDLQFDNKGIYWKKSGYGDKFKIVPNFSGADDQNKLLIQSAVGAANTDPTLNTVISIAGKTGDTEFVGNVNASKYLINNTDINSIFAKATENRIKTYYDPTQFGKSWDDITAWSGTLPAQSKLIFSVYEAVRQSLYDKGLIPINNTGVLEVVNVGRGFVKFTTDDTIWFSHSHGMNNAGSAMSTWRKLATSSDIDTLKTSFQAGCSKIATAITNNGVSTAANASPDTMASNISTLATNKYNAGNLAARNSVATALTNVGVSTASGASATDITNNINTLATGYGRFYNIMKFMSEKGHGTDLITNEAGDDIIVVKKGTTVTANFKLGTAMNKYTGTQNSDGTQFRPPIGQAIKQGSYNQLHAEYTGLNSDRNGQFIDVWTSRSLASPMKLAITGVKCGMEIFSLTLKRTDTSAWVTKWVYVLVV